MPGTAQSQSAFGERYAVFGEIGRGGMATVWRAHDQFLDRDVAIKVLDAAAAAGLDRGRFLQEIRITARLVHPGILPLFDSGSTGDGLFYVMPLMSADTLRGRLDREKQLGIEAAIAVVTDLGEALAYAHSQGIVHRDLKPENIFCSGGRAVLADFGVSHAMADQYTTDSGRLTTVGMVVGTPSYLSPEQALGETTIDGRADLYAIGCLLYEILAGQPPFCGNTLFSVIAQHVSGPIPDVCLIRPDVPPRLAQIVSRLMAKDPGARFESASALLAELRRWDQPMIAGADVRAVAVVPPAQGGSERIADPTARDAYRQGRTYWMRSVHGGGDTRRKLALARTFLDRAAQLAPDDPTILCAIADCIIVSGWRGVVPLAEALTQADSLYLKALAIDATNGMVHSALGVEFLYQQDDFESAAVAFERSAEFDPTDAMVRRQYGNYLKMAGRMDEAIAEMRMAVALDPKAPFMHLGLGDCLIAAGRNDESIDSLRAALKLAPAFMSVLERLEIACHRAGRHAEAQVTRTTVHNLRNKLERAAQIDRDVGAMGWPAARVVDVQRDLDELLARAETADPFVDHGSRQDADAIITAYADLGRWTEAMTWVERGYHRRPGRLRRVLTDMLFDRRGLAIDPRYAPLLRNAGLDELL